MEKHLAGILCGVVGLSLYLNTLSCGFCYDDYSAVLENADVLWETPWTNILWNDFWGKPLQLNSSHKSYRPLSVATFRLNYVWHGHSPMGYHVVNVVLHAVVCYLYVQLCALIFNSVWPALLAGLLFAAHPIHTEAVAGVVGRADLMCAIFYLLALLSYYRCYFPWQRRAVCPAQAVELSDGGERKWAWLCCGVACVVCALLSKEHGITALGVCLMQDCLATRQDLRDVLIQGKLKPLPSKLMPFLKRSLVLTLVGVALLAARLLMMKSAPVFSELDNEGLSLSTPHRQLYWAYLAAVNVRLLLLPAPLLHDYRMNAIPPLNSLTDPRHLLTLVTAVMLAILCKMAFTEFFCDNREYSSDIDRGSNKPHPMESRMYRTLASNKVQHLDACHSSEGFKSSSEGSVKLQTPSVISNGLLLLVLPFLPASNLFFPVGFVVAERLLYLPSMGFCLLVAHSVQGLVTSRHKVTAISVKVLVTLLLLTHSVKTLVRNQDWESKTTLYRSVLRQYPTNGYILSNMARELRAMMEYERAEAAYRYAIHMAPDVVVSYVNLASLLQLQNRSRESEKVLRGALPLLARGTVDRDQAASIYTALCNLVASNSSRLGEAEELCERATQIDQDHFKAHNSLGAVLVREGKNWRAIQSFKKAAALNRTSTAAEYNLALAYMSLGRDDLALQTLKKVLRMERDHTPARRQLQAVKERLGYS